MKVRFRMEKKQDAADVFLYDIIGDSWDGTTAKQFAEDLKNLGQVKTLNLFINSAGGSVFDGVAIYNQLQRHKAVKNVIIDGIAGSIASVIAMVGDEITIYRQAMVMIHDPWAVLAGNADELRKAADRLDDMRNTIIETYALRTGSDRADIGAWMKAESWMTAEEAVARGFADSIADQEVEIAALSKHDLKNFRNVPAAFRELLAASPLPEEPEAAPAPHPAVAKARLTLARLKQGQPS